MKRYFIVFYNRQLRNNISNNCIGEITDGSYINNMKMRVKINSNYSELSRIITNIIEVNEADYNTFFE